MTSWCWSILRLVEEVYFRPSKSLAESLDLWQILCIWINIEHSSLAFCTCHNITHTLFLHLKLFNKNKNHQIKQMKTTIMQIIAIKCLESKHWPQSNDHNVSLRIFKYNKWNNKVLLTKPNQIVYRYMSSKSINKTSLRKYVIIKSTYLISTKMSIHIRSCMNKMGT